MKTEKIFGGAGYDPQFDRARLKMQVERIRSYMLLAGWKTLREIKTDLERTYAPAMFPEGSISAQLRNLKKPPYFYRLLRRRRAGVHGPGAGIWLYRLLAPELQLGLFVDAGGMPHDGKGREEFFREARRIASEASK